MGKNTISIWAWLPLCFLFSLKIAFFNYDFDIEFNLSLPLFLPIVFSWLAFQYGRDVFKLLLFCSIFTFFRLGIDITESVILVIFIPPWICLFCIVCALHFCRPSIEFHRALLLRPASRWLLWLIPLGIAQGGFSQDLNLAIDKLAISIAPGHILAAVALMFSFNWSEIIESISKSKFYLQNKKIHIVGLVFISVLIISSFSIVTYEIDYEFKLLDERFYIFAYLTFGFFSTLIIFALAALGPLFKKWRWQYVLLFITFTFIIDSVLYITVNEPMVISTLLSVGSSNEQNIESEFWELYGKYYLQTFSLLISTFVLSLSMKSFWYSNTTTYIETKFSNIMLFTGVLLLPFDESIFFGINERFAIPVALFSLVMGFNWGVKGIIIAPIIIFNTIILYSSLGLYNLDNINSLEALPFIFSGIALVSFPYGFIGLVGNRMPERKAQLLMTNEGRV